MKINDCVYGEEVIEEKVLIEIINSKEIQRLKGISQAGLPEKYYGKKVFSRYEHSVGVLILLRRLKASIEEQIAGLIHDVSHTAFSHLVDWVVGDPSKEDYQDSIFKETLQKSSITGILKRNGFNYKLFYDLTKFSLLERPAPQLCADRIDYALREPFFFENIKEKKETLTLILNNLVNINGNIVFKRKGAAEQFALNYMKVQKEIWSGNNAKARYHLFSGALKLALDKKIISKKDLMTTDEEVITKLNNGNMQAILSALSILEKGIIVKETKNNNGIKLHAKFRYIDPEILYNETIRPLSVISIEYAKKIKEEKEKFHANSLVEISSK
ncbi:MAG: HD domain-containing protein [Nanoarchaeota archaeon]|mgnify:CR=1 FL=1